MVAFLSTIIDPPPIHAPGTPTKWNADRQAVDCRPPPPAIITSSITIEVSTDLSARQSTINALKDSGWQTGMWNRAQHVAKLRAGWDGPGSLPVSPEALYTATRITRLALDGFEQAAAPYLVPGGDGSIQVEWHEAHAELELDIGANGKLSIWGRDHLSGAEFEGEDAEAVNLFFRWAPRVAAHAGHVADEVSASEGPQFEVAA